MVYAYRPYEGTLMETTFFVDFSIVIVIAAAVILGFNYFKLPQSIGYILAGLIIGPHVPPKLITDENNIKMLSDMGVLFLMFSIGLGFSFRELKRVGMAVLIPAVIDVVVLTWAGYELGLLLGWGKIESLLLGFIICDSSTTILAKTLEESGLSKQHFAQTLFTVTLLEDVIAIIIIAMLSGFGGGDTMNTGVVFNRMGILAVFLASVIIIGLLVVPRLLARIARYRNDEVLLMTVLGLCFGVSLLAVRLELSLALGAFLIGAIIAEARPINRIEELVAPLRQLFSSIFFISMGLLVVPMQIWENIGAVLVVTAVMIFFKVVNGTVGCLLIGEKPRDSLRIGLGLAQVAEFAFIIAAIGTELELTQRPIFQIAVGVAILSTVINPFLMRLANPISRCAHMLCGARLVEGLDAYSHWLHRILSPQAEREAFNKARRDFFFLAVNLTLIAAIFLVAEYLRNIHVLDAWLQSFGLTKPAQYPVLWLLAAIVASPLYAASFVYLQHFAKNLSDSFLPAALNAAWGQKFRLFLQHIFFLLGIIAMAVGTFLLSSNLLPDWRFQLILMIIMVALIAFRWQRLNRAYVSAQTTLQELFRRESPRNELRTILSVHMRSVPLHKTSPAVGQTIVSLNIRAKTGASVLSIRRNGDYNVNPTLSEAFRIGDTILLLGNSGELDAAETLMTGLPPTRE